MPKEPTPRKNPIKRHKAVGVVKRVSTPLEEHPPCSTCRPLKDAINDYFERRGIPFKDFKIGSIQTLIQRTHCPFYQGILDLCLRWLNENSISIKLQDIIKLEQSYNSLGDENVTKLFVSIGHYHDYPTSGPDLNFIKLSPLSINKPHGRLVNQRWMDVDLIRNWIKCCDSRHRGHCRPLLKHQTPTRPRIRLIDTQRGCLVWSSGGERYAALSYVWGSLGNSAHKFHTNQSNVSKYEEEGTLEQVAIPHTIKDAIRLVSLLGQRFLWVDCFCIVQDDQESMHFNIGQMDSIYANAYFTIIAAEGDNANYGLRGVGGGSQPRDISQSILEYGPRKHLLGLAFNMAEHSVWSKRGWTFQEKLFSQRKLIFSNAIVRWMCHCIEWCEDVAAEARTITGPGYCEDVSAVGAHALRLSKDPSFTEYSQLVEDYSNTQLTREEDILHAFSGITSALSRTFVGGFHFGLPELFFDLALLWQPRTPNSRRIAIKGQSPTNRFPSWSWVGWKGQRGYAKLGWAAGCAREAEGDASWELRSTVQWYKIGEYSSIKTKISNSWQRYRSTCADPSKSLPNGWLRYPSKPLSPGLSRNRPGRASRKPTTYHYTHNTDPDIVFRFPIPLCNPNQANELKPERWSTSLFFYTSRGSLLTGDRCLVHTVPEEQCLPVCLVDERMDWAGILYLNIPCSEPTPLSFRCDLIAISAGSALNETDESFYMPEWDFDKRPKSMPRYEFYNVLWVEWYDNIAYRKGLGRVLKETWERQSLEWLNITLN